MHTPGSFFGSDYKEFVVPKGYTFTVDVMHEVFKVLEFDGDKCQNYIFGRDDCIYRTIHKVNFDKCHSLFVQKSIFKESMDEIGCTSPYGWNKSSICTDETKGARAYELFEEYTQNQTKANLKCPRTCTYMMTSFSSFTKEKNDYGGPGSLELRFQGFIKVSRSRLAYTWLELLAEVGGYVGLFLGVSINQITLLSKGLFTRLRGVFKE